MFTDLDEELAELSGQKFSGLSTWEHISEGAARFHTHEKGRVREEARIRRNSFPMTTCHVCFKEFEQRKGTKFCSAKCRRRDTYLRTKGKYKRKSQTKLWVTKCKCCGSQIVQERRYGKAKIWCGTKCAKKGAYLRKREMLWEKQPNQSNLAA